MKLTFVPLLLFALLEASHAQASDGWKVEPNDPSRFFVHEVDRALVLEVPLRCQGALAAKLANVRQIKLAAQDVRDLERCGSLTVPAGKHRYAVRAVRVGDQGGRYAAFQDGEEIYVFHGTFGSGEIKRSVVIVATEAEVKNSFANAAKVE